MTDPLMRAAARTLPRPARRWIEARLRVRLEHRTPYPALALILHAATLRPVEKDAWGHKIRQSVTTPAGRSASAATAAAGWSRCQEPKPNQKLAADRSCVSGPADATGPGSGAAALAVALSVPGRPVWPTSRPGTTSERQPHVYPVPAPARPEHRWPQLVQDLRRHQRVPLLVHG